MLVRKCLNSVVGFLVLCAISLIASGCSSAEELKAQRLEFESVDGRVVGTVIPHRPSKQDLREAENEVVAAENYRMIMNASKETPPNEQSESTELELPSPQVVALDNQYPEIKLKSIVIAKKKRKTKSHKTTASAINPQEEELKQ
ncbi:MAG: hypothetical protein ACXWQQ_11670 [Pseudobdellovibrio sp.]